MAAMTTASEVDGPLAILTFNRPEARNAMTWDMYEALVHACDRVDGDAAVRVLVLRGAGGGAFVAGTDILAVSRAFTTPGDGLSYEKRLDAALDRLERLTKPAIAQVEGCRRRRRLRDCDLAATCAIATPSSTFGVPIARTLGNCSSGATCSRLVDLLGPAARQGASSSPADMLGAADAHAMGLVNQVVAASDIAAVVRELAHEIAGGMRR